MPVAFTSLSYGAHGIPVELSLLMSRELHLFKIMDVLFSCDGVNDFHPKVYCEYDLSM